MVTTYLYASLEENIENKLFNVSNNRVPNGGADAILLILFYLGLYEHVFLPLYMLKFKTE